MSAVPIGTPITTEQFCGSVLRMIDSPIVGDIDLDRDARATVNRLHRLDKDAGITPYMCLSGGERHLVDIAADMLTPGTGARISALGGLDRDTRRKVIIGLFYLHLGRDLSGLEVTDEIFAGMFKAEVLS